MSNSKLWCSVHQPTPQQLEEIGELEYLKDIDPKLQDRLNNLQLSTDLVETAYMLALQGTVYDLVQVGGSPAFQVIFGKVTAFLLSSGYMMELEQIRAAVQDTRPIMFAFSERVSKDITQADGTIKKVSTFNHQGWARG